MTIKKKIISILTCLVMIPSTTGYALSQEGKNAEISKPVTAQEIISRIEETGSKSATENGRSLINGNYEFNRNIELGDTVVYHNNGKPMNTNIFIDKQGNELYAIVAKNINGKTEESYYMSNSGVLLEDQLDEIIAAASTRGFSEPYNWSFYRNIIGGKTKVGNARMQLEYHKTNSSMGSRPVSVWDLKARTEVHATGYAERINSSIIRMSVASGSQSLYDYEPETTSQSKFNVSLIGLIKPLEWTITAGGYTTKDLARGVSKRYGRWQFNARPGSQTYWVLRPGIRAINKVGTFYAQYSQTFKYNFSEHQTGIIQFSHKDR